MQQLHLVGFTTSSDSLILSVKKGAKSGGFVVTLDEALLESIAEAVRRRNELDGTDTLAAPAELLRPPEPPKRSSLLSPREIQARLRAGRSLTQVAREAATDEDWVAKFAPPVLAERGQILDHVRELVFSKPRRGESAEPLGISVRWNLADRGVRLTDDEFAAGWSAFHIGDAVWGATFSFVSRGRRQRAEWEVDLSADTIVARNRVASDLGFVEPGRRRRVVLLPEPDEVPTRSRRGVPASDPTADTTGRDRRRSAVGGVKRAKKAAGGARSATASPGATKATKATKKVSKRVAKVAKKASKAAAAKRPGKAGRSTTAPAKTSRVSKQPNSTGRTSKATARPRSARAAAPAGTRARRKPSSPAPAAPRRAGGVVSPPEPGAPPRPLVPAGSSPSELDRRRLEIVRAAGDDPSSPAPRVPGRRLSSRPAPSSTRQDPPEPKPTPTVPEAQGAPVTATAADDGDDAAARARREERRRARSERLGVEAGSIAASAPPAEPDGVLPTDDTRVVTIRATRASTGDVVVPGGARPLRPARPAAQPGRRRFGRNRS